MDLKEDGQALLLLLHGVDADVVEDGGVQVHQPDGGVGGGQGQLRAVALLSRDVHHPVAWGERGSETSQGSEKHTHTHTHTLSSLHTRPLVCPLSHKHTNKHTY